MLDVPPLAWWEFHFLQEEKEVTVDVGKSIIPMTFPAYEERVGGQRLQTEASTAYDLSIATHIFTCHPISM